MYEIGEAYSFTPSANIEKSAGFGKELNVKRTGEIVYINAQHRFIRVKLALDGMMLYESFKY